MSELGERLRRERRRRGETQAEAGARHGVSQPSYARWESGHTAPGVDSFGSVANYLGLTIGEVAAMVGGGEEPTSLDLLAERIAEMQRDIEDLRATIKQLSAEVAPPR